MVTKHSISQYLGLEQLADFQRIVQSGSIAKAASETGKATSVFARCVAALESSLGVKLLEPAEGEAALTEAGMRLHERSVEILSRVKVAHEEVRRIAENPTSLTTFAIPPTAAAVLANAVAIQFRTALPNARLRFVDGMSGHIREWLATGRIDVGVVYGSPATAGEKLWTEELFLVGDYSMLQGQGPTYPFDQLGHLPLVLPSPAHGLRQRLESYAQQHGLRLSIVIEADSLNTMLDLVRERIALTILPRAAVLATQAPSNPLRCLRIVDPCILRTLVLATSSNRPISRTTHTLLDIIRKEAHKLQARKLILAPTYDG